MRQPARTNGAHWLLLLALAAQLGLQAGAVFGGAERLPHTHLALGGSAAAQAAALTAHAQERPHAHPTAERKLHESPVHTSDVRVLSLPAGGAALALGLALDSGVLAAVEAMVGPKWLGQALAQPGAAVIERPPTVPLPPPRLTG
jgi:hypothetical protein